MPAPPVSDVADDAGPHAVLPRPFDSPIHALRRREATNAPTGVEQPGGWVLDDGCKAGIRCQNTLADIIDCRGQQGDAVGVAAVQVHFSADLGLDSGYVQRHPCGCERVEEELF